jgi:hypothetical protein
MLNDIVVDTNILLHAQNPEEARFAAANEFISKMFTTLSRRAKLGASCRVKVPAGKSAVTHSVRASHPPVSSLGLMAEL